MIPHLFSFSDPVQPVPGTPLAERILEGQPTWRTWKHFATPDGSMYAGLWESTPGKWRIDYQRWEFMSVQEGTCIITHESGAEYHLHSGSTLVIEPGFKGTWQVNTTMKKLFFIRQNPAVP
jgi:uncharacterized protein